jgi:Secretion system C-terminal sorting domain
MRKAILVASLAITGANAIGQCTPNQLYADSIYGVWPDTTENFASGVLNIFYSDTLTILVPTDAGLVDPNYAGVSIDSVALTGVDNLPPGLSVICNSQTSAACTFLSSQLGCGLIEGTPTAAGVYDMTINVIAYAFGGFVQVAQPFAGYQITIAEDNSGIAGVASIKPLDVRAIPNPSAGSTSFMFSLPHAAKARVQVFNLVGEKLWDRSVAGKQGANTVGFDASQLESGMYLYTVEAGGHTYTSRLVVN